jgi:hypothetical protein
MEVRNRIIEEFAQSNLIKVAMLGVQLMREREPRAENLVHLTCAYSLRFSR